VVVPSIRHEEAHPALHFNSSATIIGVGFVGFGFLIIVPGLCWCL